MCSLRRTLVTHTSFTAFLDKLIEAGLPTEVGRFLSSCAFVVVVLSQPKWDYSFFLLLCLLLLCFLCCTLPTEVGLFFLFVVVLSFCCCSFFLLLFCFSSRDCPQQELAGLSQPKWEYSCFLLFLFSPEGYRNFFFSSRRLNKLLVFAPF